MLELLLKKPIVLENDSGFGTMLLKILLNGNNTITFMIKRSIKKAKSLFRTEACARNSLPFLILSMDFVDLSSYLIFWFLSSEESKATNEAKWNESVLVFDINLR